MDSQVRRRHKSTDFSITRLHGLSIRLNEEPAVEKNRRKLLRELSLVQQQLSTLAKTNNERLSFNSAPTSPLLSSPIFNQSQFENPNSNRWSSLSTDSNETLFDDNNTLSPSILGDIESPVFNEIDQPLPGIDPLKYTSRGSSLINIEEPGVTDAAQRLREDIYLLILAIQRACSPPEWFIPWFLAMSAAILACFISIYFEVD